MTDEEYMRLALDEAGRAAALDEVPVGAVVVRRGEIIARAHNTRETGKCALDHAEITAIRAACRKDLAKVRSLGLKMYGKSNTPAGKRPGPAEILFQTSQKRTVPLYPFYFILA